MALKQIPGDVHQRGGGLVSSLGRLFGLSTHSRRRRRHRRRISRDNESHGHICPQRQGRRTNRSCYQTRWTESTSRRRRSRETRHSNHSHEGAYQRTRHRTEPLLAHEEVRLHVRVPDARGNAITRLANELEMIRQRSRRRRPSSTREVDRSAEESSIQERWETLQPLDDPPMILDTPMPDYENMDEEELWATIYAEERAANPVVGEHEAGLRAAED